MTAIKDDSLVILHQLDKKKTLPSTAAGTSASSKTIKEALPPSSMETFFMVPED
jgi:hypothetical protein